MDKINPWLYIQDQKDDNEDADAIKVKWHRREGGCDWNTRGGKVNGTRVKPLGSHTASDLGGHRQVWPCDRVTLGWTHSWSSVLYLLPPTRGRCASVRSGWGGRCVCVLRCFVSGCELGRSDRCLKSDQEISARALSVCRLWTELSALQLRSVVCCECRPVHSQLCERELLDTSRCLFQCFWCSREHLNANSRTLMMRKAL